MHKNVLRIVVLSAMCFLFAATSRFSLTAGSPEGQLAPRTGGEVLQRAEQLTDIRSGDVPSFRLIARVEVYDEKHKAKEGKYILLWNSPTIWREEITFPDYSQTVVARVNKLLISRNPPAPSEDAYRVGKLMDFSALLRLSIRDQILGLHEKAKNGSPERSVDIAITGGRPWKKVYFAGSALVPARIEFKGTALGVRYPYKDFDLRFQFGDYKEFHGLQFPQALDQFESNVLKAQGRVQEWTEVTFGESDFVPPDNSHWIRWCPHVEPPRSRTEIFMVNPSLPPQLRTGGPASRVVISGIIGVDGQWHNIEAVKSGGGMVDSFWIDVMRKQRFTPAQCGEIPVEYEMMMEFDYP